MLMYMRHEKRTRLFGGRTGLNVLGLFFGLGGGRASAFQVCGVRCNPDEKEHTQAHMRSKTHDAYTQIRNKTRELREKQRKRDEETRLTLVRGRRVETEAKHIGILMIFTKIG